MIRKLEQAGRGRGFTLIELMIVIAIIAILAAILVPSYVRARAMTQLTACKSNLKNVATALEAYSVDHAGHFPVNLNQLTPNYMKTLPICPAAATNTYDSNYLPGINPDTYFFNCVGTNHTGLGLDPDYPQWDSGQGLIERMP